MLRTHPLALFQMLNVGKRRNSVPGCYEAATGYRNLGLDEHNAHVQPNGSYHYHALPTGLVERLGGDGKKMVLIGWAADGLPLYTSSAHAQAKDAKSALHKMNSSFRHKNRATFGCLF